MSGRKRGRGPNGELMVNAGTPLKCVRSIVGRRVVEEKGLDLDGWLPDATQFSEMVLQPLLFILEMKLTSRSF